MGLLKTALLNMALLKTGAYGKPGWASKTNQSP
jgi:hypothetical protein